MSRLNLIHHPPPFSNPWLIGCYTAATRAKYAKSPPKSG